VHVLVAPDTPVTPPLGGISLACVYKKIRSFFASTRKPRRTKNKTKQNKNNTKKKKTKQSEAALEMVAQKNLSRGGEQGDSGEACEGH